MVAEATTAESVDCGPAHPQCSWGDLPVGSSSPQRTVPPHQIVE